MSEKTTYYKNGDGFVLNQFYKDGAEVVLHSTQAKYMIAPLGTELRAEKKRTIKPAVKSAPRPTSRKDEAAAQ